MKVSRASDDLFIVCEAILLLGEFEISPICPMRHISEIKASFSLKPFAFYIRR